jgi:hypothetical protein
MRVRGTPEGSDWSSPAFAPELMRPRGRPASGSAGVRFGRHLRGSRGREVEAVSRPSGPTRWNQCLRRDAAPSAGSPGRGDSVRVTGTVGAEPEGYRRRSRPDGATDTFTEIPPSLLKTPRRAPRILS